MLRWSQIQLIVDKLSGQQRLRVRPDELDEPWRTIYERIEPPDDPDLMERALWQASAGLDDRYSAVEEILEALPELLPQHSSLADLAADLPPVEWLWTGWLPRGFLSLLGGVPGAGKSLVALDLACRVIHGRPFPGQDPPGDPDPAVAEASLVACHGASHEARNVARNVVYVDAEAVPQILNQRAEAWGLDRKRLYLMLPNDAYALLDLGCAAQQDRLIRMVYDLKAALVVVDSLGSISLKGENQVEDVRALLSFLSALAGELEVAVLLIHHLRKRSQLAMRAPVTADDFRGSSHIIARAASVLALSTVRTAPGQDRNAPRRLEVVKTNLAAYPTPLGVYIEPGAAQAPILRYGEAPRAYRPLTQTDHCAAWLEDLLRDAGEPLKPKEVIVQAREAGYSQATLYRARSRLEQIVGNTKLPHDRDNQWRLLDS